MIKLLYVITKSSGDERAIIKALNYRKVFVEKVKDELLEPKRTIDFDYLLFNHSKYLDKIRSCYPKKICWCFDLMTHDTYDPRRLRTRKTWAKAVTYLADYAFFTDGNFVEETNRENTIWLTQGAQQVKKIITLKQYPLLIAASIYEESRRKFAQDLKKRYSSKLHIVKNNKRVFEDEYALLVQQSEIVVAPETPIKSKYWSNRVWIVLGYGGFLLHPYIKELASILKDKTHLVYYKPNDRKDLYQKIDYYLEHPEEREVIASQGMEEIRRLHTYQSRVDKLLSILQGRGS